MALAEFPNVTSRTRVLADASATFRSAFGFSNLRDGSGEAEPFDFVTAALCVWLRTSLWIELSFCSDSALMTRAFGSAEPSDFVTATALVWLRTLALIGLPFCSDSALIMRASW